MIEIRIRDDASSLESVHLADVYDLDDVEKIIPLLNRWTVFYNGEERTPVGQFMVTDRAAYFEVIMVREDD